MRELKITRTNYERMVDVFKEGLEEIYIRGSRGLENYFRVEIEDNYIIDWYWSSQTPNTYFVDEDITVYHLSDFYSCCHIDCVLDDCSYGNYEDDENGREKYYEENKENIIDYCIDCDLEDLEYNLFEDTDIDFEVEIEEN